MGLEDLTEGDKRFLQFFHEGKTNTVELAAVAEQSVKKIRDRISRINKRSPNLIKSTKMGYGINYWVQLDEKKLNAAEDVLTPRQMEVVRYFAENRGNPEKAAEALGVGTRSVRCLVSRINGQIPGLIESKTTSSKKYWVDKEDLGEPEVAAVSLDAEEIFDKENFEEIVVETPDPNSGLETIVEVSETSRVAYISEVSWNSKQFEDEGHKAYQALLDFIEQDKTINAILVDGADSRLDRPEFLCKALSYWERSEEECEEASNEVRNRNQYSHMMGIGLEISEENLIELKKRVPEAKIVYSLHSEDFQYTLSAMLNERLLRHQAQIQDNINKKKGTRDGWRRERAQKVKEKKTLKKKEGTSYQRSGLTKSIKSLDDKLENVENGLTELYSEQRLYREKKVRPMHQQVTKELLEGVIKMYQEMCDRVGVELVMKGGKLKFGDMIIDYSHSRHPTWGVISGRQEKLLKSLYNRNDLTGVDFVLESGHHGIGWKKTLKLRNAVGETNFKNQAAYDPEIGEDHITVVMAPPFESQESIRRYSEGDEIVRMSGGKPMGTRKSTATDRYSKPETVSALTILTKYKNGLHGVRFIQHKNFTTKKVLKQPEEYKVFLAISDEHIASPESNPMVLDGVGDLFLEYVQEGSDFEDRQAKLVGVINAGDIGEANSSKWPDRYHYQRNVRDVLPEYIKLLAEVDPSNVDSVLETALTQIRDVRTGSVESMDVVLDHIACYLTSYLEPLLEHSNLKDLQVLVDGNHIGDIFRKHGLRETSYYVQHLKALKTGFNQVGVADFEGKDKDARVRLGGYSVARVIQVDDYGMSTDGETALFGPINLVVQHDPKGSGISGVVGAGKCARADLTIGGHTHENEMYLYRTGDGELSVAYRSASLQGTTPTELKYANEPRTQGAQILSMPTPGDIAELMIPAPYLKVRGKEVIRQRVLKAINKK